MYDCVVTIVVVGIYAAECGVRRLHGDGGLHGMAQGLARWVLAWLVTAGLSLTLYGMAALGLGVVADPASAIAGSLTLGAGLACMQQVYNFYRRLRDAQKASVPPPAPASTAGRPPLPPAPPPPPPPPPSPAPAAARSARLARATASADVDCADCV
ncbi:hypothetical protein R5R35_006098 [Gryllus longicercus]|uniref:Uncharacterized protein n=1 Tax=Gryllus longicercus TaxID=2509291 RepID=A0AAN9ZET1_9ORTH